MLKTAFALVFGALLVGCGGPLHYQVASSPKAPGADADITATIAPEQNQTSLEISVTNLPPAERVHEGAKAYVAWHRKDDDAQWSRIGSLKYDEETRAAELKATVPEVAFDLSITAEEQDSPASPSGDAVVSQRIEE